MNARGSRRGRLTCSLRTRSGQLGPLAERLEVAFTTAQRAVNRLEALGAVSRIGEERRDRVYCAQAILDVLEELP